MYSKIVVTVTTPFGEVPGYQKIAYGIADKRHTLYFNSIVEII